jgi:hypothetical protein
VLNRFATFSPLDLNPELWLDAADTATITESSGSVSQWDDKSGNGRNVTQGTGAAQPTTGTQTINGLNVIDFDGNDFLVRADDAGMRPSTMTTFIVFNRTGTGRRDMFSCGNSGTFGTNNWIHGHTGTAQGFFGRTPTSNLTSGTISGDTVARWVHNGSTLTGALNGVATFNTSSTIGTNNTLGITVGASRIGLTTPNAPFIGKFAELLFFPTVLSASDIAAVETYLSAKWGI